MTDTKNSSRNARRQGKIEHLKTDPGMQVNISNGVAINNYNDQRSTYDTGKKGKHNFSRPKNFNKMTKESTRCG